MFNIAIFFWYIHHCDKPLSRAPLFKAHDVCLLLNLMNLARSRPLMILPTDGRRLTMAYRHCRIIVTLEAIGQRSMLIIASESSATPSRGGLRSMHYLSRFC